MSVMSYLFGIVHSKQDAIEGYKDVKYFFLKASNEIAAGMTYLSGKSFVHRDLAARNILLNNFLTCKVRCHYFNSSGHSLHR